MALSSAVLSFVLGDKSDIEFSIIIVNTDRQRPKVTNVVNMLHSE